MEMDGTTLKRSFLLRQVIVQHPKEFGVPIKVDAQILEERSSEQEFMSYVCRCYMVLLYLKHLQIIFEFSLADKVCLVNQNI